MNRLQEKYEKEIKEKLVKEFNLKNAMAIPQIEKIVINMGAGEMIKNKELKEKLSNDLAAITGQKPSVRLAKVSIATFGVRIGMPVGLTVTLRGEHMYDFLDKLFSIALPRLRDFRGLPLKSFDKKGNYTIGLAEHTTFPEIDVTKASVPHGIEITIVIKSADPEKGKKLLEYFGMPFEKA
jgi:large subunit ribosomal protein L5